MKKLCAIFLIMIIPLCGCDPSTYYFDADEIMSQATKIELAVCENANPVIVDVGEDTVLYFDVYNATIIKELPQEKINDFAYELSTITFHKEARSVDSPTGYTLLIHMKTQEIIVLSCTVIDGTAYGMASVFSNTGDFIMHIAKFADEPKFKRLLITYFELY